MPEPSRRRPSLLLAVLAVLFVVVPFLFWRGTWFGRALRNDEIGLYLQDTAHPRKIQHALSQVADRLMRGDTALRPLYPRIVALGRHPQPEIRNTAAWVMGQDNTSEVFHQALLGLLKDSALMVRRNAALALVRFQDASGRPELVSVLAPYSVRAPADGTVSIPVQPGQRVGSGSLLARIRHDARETEIRSPFAGEIAAVPARDQARLSEGDSVVSLLPETDQVWEALRALHRVGLPEDLAAVERYERNVPDMPARIREQAQYTAEAIRTRSERTHNR